MIISTGSPVPVLSQCSEVMSRAASGRPDSCTAAMSLVRSAVVLRIDRTGSNGTPRASVRCRSQERRITSS